MIKNENITDCTSRADKPLVNIPNFSSCQRPRAVAENFVFSTWNIESVARFQTIYSNVLLTIRLNVSRNKVAFYVIFGLNIRS